MRLKKKWTTGSARFDFSTVTRALPPDSSAGRVDLIDGQFWSQPA